MPIADTVIKITIEGIEGRSYEIQYSEDLGQDNNWKTLEKITLERQYIKNINVE